MDSLDSQVPQGFPDLLGQMATCMVSKESRDWRATRGLAASLEPEGRRDGKVTRVTASVMDSSPRASRGCLAPKASQDSRESRARKGNKGTLGSMASPVSPASREPLVSSEPLGPRASRVTPGQSPPKANVASRALPECLA